MVSNPHLPPELLDHVVDLLYDAQDALEACCLVSKSCIPRTRKHLFSHIVFDTTQKLQSWKTTFRDPSTSPASYARFLYVKLPQVITDADAEEGGWISTFSKVVHLEIGISRPDIDEPDSSLIPFHGFSPDLQSLRVTFTDFLPSYISDFIHSFPLLQDIAVTARYAFSSSNDFHTRLARIQPSGPLTFTGTLKLSLELGMGPIASPLLSLPNGLRFRNLRLTRNCEEDVRLATALVERCASTLETLKIKRKFSGTILRRPRSQRRLTSLCRCAVGRDRPFESDKTRRNGVYVLAAPPMGHQDAPDRHIQPQQSSADPSLYIRYTL